MKEIDDQVLLIVKYDLNGKKHTNKIAIPAGHINLSRIDDWFRAGNLNIRAYSVFREVTK